MKDKQASPTEVADDESYELDLEEDDSSNLQDAIDEAVAAVERNDGKIEVVIEDDEDTDGDNVAEASGEEGSSTEGDQDTQDRIEQLQGEVSDLRDRLTRTLADFDNFRKRTERDKASLRNFAVSEVLEDFLGIVDNLERACSAPGSVEDLKQGVQMILRLFEDTFRRHGAEKISSVGEPFDPTRHEAVSKTESSEVDKPTVTAELQPGYKFRDRLLRPAMVSVAMPAAPATGAEDSSPEADDDDA